MPNKIDGSGRPLPNTDYVKVAAGQTTANISVAGDAVPGEHYVSHLIITAASTAAPGAVTLLDGTTSILVHLMNATVASETCQTVNVDVTATTTKGFNVTTGTSVSVVVVGRF
jgi:hypothetical protein